MRRGPRQASDSLDVLEACDPLRRSGLASEGIEAALDEIGAAITSRSRRTPRAKRRRSLGGRRAVLIFAAAIVAISAGVATGAVVFGAHTGLFPTKEEEAVGGPGEALNPAAADFRAVALQVASDIPYPDGYASWREWVLKTQADLGASAGGSESPSPAGLLSTGALRGWFAASAFCAWVQSWRDASIAGDANATAQAAQTIAEAPSWKAVTDLDPRPDASAANDPGAEAGTMFGWMLPYRDAVLAGDRARVEHLLATGYGGGRCWLNDPVWMAQVQAHGDDWAKLSQGELAQKYKQFLMNGRS